MSCTSKWRMPRVRDAASRTAANASGSRSSSVSPSCVALAQPVGLFAELVVGEGLEGALQGIDGIGIVPQLPQGFFVTRAEKFFDK